MLSDNFNPLFSRPRYFVNSSSVIFQSVKLQFSPVFLFRYFHIAPPSTPLRQSVAAISRLICRSADVDCISPMNFALSQLTVSRKLAEVRRESRNGRIQEDSVVCTTQKYDHLQREVCEKFMAKVATTDRRMAENVDFYRAMLCISGTSHGPVSVCPSVRPSVRHKSEFY